MGEYDKVCIETFLRDQLKLFPEKVAETRGRSGRFSGYVHGSCMQKYERSTGNILTKPEQILPA